MQKKTFEICGFTKMQKNGLTTSNPILRWSVWDPIFQIKQKSVFWISRNANETQFSILLIKKHVFSVKHRVYHCGNKVEVILVCVSSVIRRNDHIFGKIMWKYDGDEIFTRNISNDFLLYFSKINKNSHFFYWGNLLKNK